MKDSARAGNRKDARSGGRGRPCDTDRSGASPLAGGWARLESFSGKGYGQTIGW